MSNIYRVPKMQEALKRTIKSLMVKNAETYDGLAQKLAKDYGVQHNALTLKSKINKGTIGAQLFIYTLLALGLKQLNLDELEELMNKVDKDKN